MTCSVYPTTLTHQITVGNVMVSAYNTIVTVQVHFMFLIIIVELSDCLSFGCTDETGDCRCLYSTSCPLKRFPYYTLEECAEALIS